MAGTQTAGFDLVMQFSEDALQELLGVFFDSSGIIPRLVDLIPTLDGSEFTLSVSLDRPTDVTLDPPGAENPLDIRLGLGTGGSLATLRIVVGIVVDRTDPNQDQVEIDFGESIYFAQATLGGVNVPIPNLRGRLADIIPTVPVLPVPVERTSSNATDITRVDFRIVDDTTAADRDAISAMLTFGGGTAGDAASLRSFVPDGGRGAIGIFFAWLCRMATPRLEESLGLPAGSFTITSDSCSLNRNVVIDEDEDVTLTSLSMSLDDGFIRIAARVTKSGFCYDASGDVSASLRIAIVDGRLQASAEIGDPDVNVDIPWYCWLAAGVIGAVVGGILLGVIGAIVGAVLVPLILWLAVDVVEGTIDRVADRIVEAINEAVPEIDVPAFGINILFQSVFIDDVVIQAELDVEDHSPVRSQGTVLLRPGQGLDLDSGKVVDRETGEADVSWEGRGYGRRLESGCQAALARTSTGDFANVARFTTYGLNYETRTSVSFWELGIPNPFGFLLGDDVWETRRVYAIRTNEGRYGLVQATEIDDDGWVRLRYKTWETNQPAVSIVGEFQCVGGLRIPRDAVAKFEPKLVATAFPDSRVAAASATVTAGVRVAPAASPAATLSPGYLSVVAASAVRSKKHDPCDDDEPSKHDEPGGTGAKPGGRSPGAAVALPPGTRVFPIKPVYDGRWVAEFDGAEGARAKLHAATTGTKGKLQYLWELGGTRLEDGSSGSVTVFGVKVSYEVKQANLVLSVAKDAVVELFVRVTVVDDGGCSATSSRCIHHEGKCPRRVRYVPTWNEFKALQALAPAVVASGLVTTSRGMLSQPALVAPPPG
jgi:hypothetical protein